MHRCHIWFILYPQISDFQYIQLPAGCGEKPAGLSIGPYRHHRPRHRDKRHVFRPRTIDHAQSQTAPARPSGRPGSLRPAWKKGSHLAYSASDGGGVGCGGCHHDGHPVPLGGPRTASDLTGGAHASDGRCKPASLSDSGHHHSPAAKHAVLAAKAKRPTARRRETAGRFFIGRRCEIRTRDQRIKSPLLYRLS